MKEIALNAQLRVPKVMAMSSHRVGCAIDGADDDHPAAAEGTPAEDPPFRSFFRAFSTRFTASAESRKTT
jgi:hypothetical protein